MPTSTTYFTAANAAGTPTKFGAVTETVSGNTVDIPVRAITPAAQGGCSIYRSIDLDETEEEIKATAGQIYAIKGYNANASVRYLKLYNATAASTTVGTTTPVFTLPLEAQKSFEFTPAYPMEFTTAICAAVTTGLADNNTGAPSDNDVIVNFLYK